MKTGKKLLAAVLTVTMLMAAAPAPVKAETEVEIQKTTATETDEQKTITFAPSTLIKMTTQKATYFSSDPNENPIDKDYVGLSDWNQYANYLGVAHIQLTDDNAKNLTSLKMMANIDYASRNFHYGALVFNRDAETYQNHGTDKQDENLTRLSQYYATSSDATGYTGFKEVQLISGDDLGRFHLENKEGF